MADYIIGDVHGDQVLWDACISPMLKAGDRAFVLGDFGVGFWNGRYWSEETFYDYLEQQPRNMELVPVARVEEALRQLFG